VPGSTPTALTAESLAAKQAELDKREAALNTKQATQDRANNAAFCEQLQKDGKITPALAEGLVDFLSGLQNSAPVSFGEGDGKTEKAPLDFMKEFLGRLPKLVEFADVAGGHKAPKADTGGEAVHFAAAPGFTVTPEGLAELGKAKAYAKDHNCDLLTAVAAINGASK
jgi:hypothetical protein